MPEDTVVAEEQQEAGGKKKGSKMGLIIIVVAVVFILGAVFFAMTLNKKDEPEEKELDPDTFVYYTFGEIVTNVNKSNHRLNLMTTICVVVPNEKVAAQITKHEPKFRDLMLKILGSKELEDLDVVGKERIRSEIKKAINSSPELTEGEILDVYFNDFVVGP